MRCYCIYDVTSFLNFVLLLCLSNLFISTEQYHTTISDFQVTIKKKDKLDTTLDVRDGGSNNCNRFPLDDIEC